MAWQHIVLLAVASLSSCVGVCEAFGFCSIPTARPVLSSCTRQTSMRGFRQNVKMAVEEDKEQHGDDLGEIPLMARRAINQQSLALIGSAASLLLLPKDVKALCGSKPSSWEFWIPWDEQGIKTSAGMDGTAANGGRTVFYRVVGDKSREKEKLKGKEIRRKPVIVVSDKFRDHTYLSVLEAIVTSDRRVVLYDAMGEGESEVLPAPVRSKLAGSEDEALSFSVKELSDVVTALKKDLEVPSFHLYGDGYGAKVVAAYAAGDVSSVSSLILARPPKGIIAPQNLQVLYTADPSALCTADASSAERETYVRSVNEFADSVDGSSSL